VGVVVESERLFDMGLSAISPFDGSAVRQAQGALPARHDGAAFAT